MRRISLLFLPSLVITCVGALAVTARLPDPIALKPPLITLGLAGLVLPVLLRQGFPRGLYPFLLFWLYDYLRITHTAGATEAATMHLCVFLAFLAGYLRVPIFQAKIVIPLVVICVGRGVIDLFTLAPLGIAESSPLGAVTSFFGNKHFFGGVLILGAFQHFYLMEKGEPHKPVQVLLYTSAAIILAALLLTDSRLAQGAFFMSILPVLFLSLRLDGREPAPERIAWIIGITICLGLIWINLPDSQWQRTARFLSPPSSDNLKAAWGAAWRTFLTAPGLGAGLGGFRFAAAAHAPTWLMPDDDNLIPQVAHAGNHLLENLAETGLVGTVMELTILSTALGGLAWFYYNKWRVEAKYGFFGIVALSIMGGFCSILETAPGRLVYWGLIGYGFSLAVETSASRAAWLRDPPGGISSRMQKAIAAATACAMVALCALHLTQRAQGIRSELVSQVARATIRTNLRSATDMLAEALRLNPRNEEANYAYSEVLAQFHQETDAIRRFFYIQGFAPDQSRLDEALSSLYMNLGRFDSSALYATRLLARHPYHLPSWEILAGSLLRSGRCGPLDSLAAASATLLDIYPMPHSQDYTVEALDSLFRTNEDLNFVQRWFGGKALKQQFVERKLLAYNLRFQNHSRAQFLKDARCPETEMNDSGSMVPKRPPPEHRLYHKWRGIG